MKPRTARGMTLIEVMVAMTVLLVGMLGMMSLQIWGLNSNQGARANTTAAQLAKELASALERLPFGDPRLEATGTFGGLLQADGSVTGGYTEFVAVPGARANEEIERGGDGQPVYQRRWTVLVRQTAGLPSTKIIAVSVIYRERGIPRPKEVVIYGFSVDRSLLATLLVAS